MEAALKVKDVVQSKSGGPDIKIEEIFEHENVRMALCKFPDGKQGAFPLDSLILVPLPTLLPSKPWG
jgi:uncharacterized protein YodC (DUF2158 family)